LSVKNCPQINAIKYLTTDKKKFIVWGGGAGYHKLIKINLFFFLTYMLSNAILQILINKGESNMYLVIKENYRRIDYSSYAYEIKMHTNDYSLAVDFADCKQREADELGERDLTFKVVEFPSNFKFESEIEADTDAEFVVKIDDVN
jgi:hypothetical protein